ncbi:putative BNR repeat neuraminidase [Marinoscillum furvescens DSM 4134]|uniref:Putative BNR repeat neuraminidase n=2 Tax=Marinoscillum furvescens TaxID=1026 RepID=A0A3D9L1M5_MARFU|nr:putative BNR repeat neuraminidase [Marinoscillum furvescens DSM 4134]
MVVLCLLLVVLTAARAQYKEQDQQPITFMEDGGWCWYEDPRVIIHEGKLIIGTISGVSGDIRVGVYDLEQNELEGVAVLDKAFEVDDHNSPVFYVREDGSLLAVWAKHGRENKHYYSISSPDNYLQWSERQVYTHDFDLPDGSSWGGVTYMNLYTIEKQGLLYNFYRNGPDLNPTYITSADGGNTWGHTTHLIKDEVAGKQRPYVRYMQLNDNQIGISFTDGHPRVYGNSIYYATFDGESFYRANGEKIKSIAQGPLQTSEAEKVYVGSETKEKPEGSGSVPDAAWTCDLEKDKKGNPHIGYTLFLENSDNRFRLASWTGKKWVDREIAYAGVGLYPREASYTGLIALDPEDPTRVIISTPVDPNTGEEKGVHEIYMARVKPKDDTQSIEWKQLTDNSTYKNIRPIIVAGDGYKVVLWLGGKPWTHYQSFETSIMGYVLEKPKK